MDETHVQAVRRHHASRHERALRDVAVLAESHAAEVAAHDLSGLDDAVLPKLHRVALSIIKACCTFGYPAAVGGVQIRVVLVELEGALPGRLGEIRLFHMYSAARRRRRR